MKSRPVRGAARQFLFRSVLFGIALALSVFCACAEECPGNPGAIGTSRVVSVDPTVLHQVGTMQYPQTLPLRDHEIVLSFDDGPSPVTTEKVLDALAAECVKANFFIVGEHANERPDLVRRAYREGHAIGTHSQTHADLSRLSLAGAVREIDDGIQSVQAALGPQMTAAPFFRAPYLQITFDLEQFLFKCDVMLWSIDIDPEDWRPRSARRRRRTHYDSSGSEVLGHRIAARCAAAYGGGNSAVASGIKSARLQHRQGGRTRH